MKSFSLFLLAALILTASYDALQANPNNLLQSSSRRRADASAKEETAKRIAEAEAHAAVEKARLAREAAAKTDMAAKARAALLADEQPAPTPNTDRIQAALEDLSDEGRERLNAPVAPARKAEVVEDDETVNAPPVPPVLLAQAAPTAAVNTPTQAIPPPATSASPDTPKPQPLKPTPLEDPKVEASKIRIFSDEAFLDAGKSIGVFVGNVRVYHPQFYLESDHLEVFMKENFDKDSDAKSQEEATPAPVVAGNPAPPAADAGEDEEEDSAIDKIIARGAMVIIEKFTEDGDIQVGKCRHFTYEDASGIGTLRIKPQVQRGYRLQIGRNPESVITIDRKGKLSSSGGVETEIIQNPPKQQTKGLRRAPEP